MKKIINLKIIIITILIGMSSLFPNERKPEFSLDYGQFFRGSSEMIQVEIYLSVPKCNISYNDSLRGSYSIKLKIYNEDDKLIAKDYWGRKVNVKNKEESWSTAEVADIAKVKLKPGVYRLLAEVKDLTSGKTANIDIPVSSKLFKVEKLQGDFSLSSIQLCSRIIPNGDKKSEFYKNGIVVLPNPSKIFGTLKPFLSYYTEVYGTEKGKKYIVNWAIQDNSKKIIKTGKEKIKTAPGSSMVLLDRVKVHNLKSGAYNLIIKVKDEDGKVLKKTTTFKIYRSIDFNKQKKVAAENLGDYIDVLKKEDLELEFQMLQSILSKSEKEISKQLNVEGKRNFVKKYWKEKEAKRRGSRDYFMSMVKEANRLYSSSKKNGWQTDMGRILLKMGKPDKKEVNTYDMDSQDHEIWHYFDGNYIFVFADLHNFGTFKLLHSTYQGEKLDINWRKKVEKKGGDYQKKDSFEGGF